MLGEDLPNALIDVVADQIHHHAHTKVGFLIAIQSLQGIDTHGVPAHEIRQLIIPGTHEINFPVDPFTTTVIDIANSGEAIRIDFFDFTTAGIDVIVQWTLVNAAVR